MKYLSGSCQGEICSQCKTPATHKVQESILWDDPAPARHEFTAYICCTCFQKLFGATAQAYCLHYQHPPTAKI